MHHCDACGTRDRGSLDPRQGIFTASAGIICSTKAAPTARTHNAQLLRPEEDAPNLADGAADLLKLLVQNLSAETRL